MKKRNSDNRGLSLIELIVVVAILGIVSVGATSSLGLLYSTSAKEAATKLNSAMAKTRVEAMSKSQASLRLYEKDSEYYVQLIVNDKEESIVQIGNSRVDITYVRSDHQDQVLELPSKGVLLEFNRETGGLKPLEDGGGNAYCKKIIITSGNRTYNVVCERLTGKTRIE